MRIAITTLLLLSLAGCNSKQPASNTAQPAPAAQQATASSELKEGEASGTITDEGETFTIKYAYAGWGRQFDEDAVVLLLTDKPLPSDSLDKVLAEPFQAFVSGGVHGLQYRIAKSSFWVKYHPSQFQTSGINTLKEYSVESDLVKGRDEDGTLFDGKEYKRSVSFMARLPKH